MNGSDVDVLTGFDARIAQREVAMAQSHPLEMKTSLPEYQTTGVIPNTPLSVSTISFLLGIVFTIGFAIFYFGGRDGPFWCTSELGFFITTWAAFHWGEFAVTAGWNRPKCNVDSFLLDNGIQYHAAHLTALSEYFVFLYLKPSWKGHPYLSVIGMVMVLLGQAMRTTAMIHASTNFSHLVQYRKHETHRLVTDGVYAWSRHPSYAGFFYWGLGTQLVLQNPMSFVLYGVLLWRFFSNRIRSEESALVRFFGQDYIQYRAKVGTKIPFIR